MAKKALKTVFKWNNVQVPFVASVTPPSITYRFQESSDLDSDAVRNTPTLLELGDVAVTINFDASNSVHQDIVGDAYSGEIRRADVILPDGTTSFVWDAFISDFPFDELVPDGIQRVTFTLKADNGMDASAFNISGYEE